MGEARGRDWLLGQLTTILNFWYPAAVDRRHGGYLNMLDADGAVLDAERKPLVASCRFAVLFSLGKLTGTGGDWCHEAAAEAVDFVWRAHRDPVHGGYFWQVRGDQPQDRSKQAYGHAFVVLAGAMALRAEIPNARQLLDDATEIAERQFFRGGDLAINTASEDFSSITDYRGQNANMHFCEAFIAAYEATGEQRYLDRAYRIADALARRLATQAGGYVWENFDVDWNLDWSERPRAFANMESPYGYMAGHQLEWAKLLCILARYHDAEWLVPQAVHLYRMGWEHGWNDADGGFYTGHGRGLKLADTESSYWSASEAIGGAAALAAATGNPDYWDYYDRAWQYALTHLVDHAHGGWFKKPELPAERSDRNKGDGFDPDYHPGGAIYEALRSLELIQKASLTAT